MTNKNSLALICLVLLSMLSLSVNGDARTDVPCNKTDLLNNWCHETIPGTTCIKGFCECDSGYHWSPFYRGCIATRKYDEVCHSPVQCLFHIDSQMRCEKQGPRTSVCDCPWPLIVSQDKLFCRFSRADLGDMCECHDDCITDNSWCHNNHCQCRPYHKMVHGTRCLPIKRSNSPTIRCSKFACSLVTVAHAISKMTRN